MRKMLLAAGLILATTSASMAQGYVYGTPYGGSGAYDYGPGPGPPGCTITLPVTAMAAIGTTKSVPMVPAAATARSHSADVR